MMIAHLTIKRRWYNTGAVVYFYPCWYTNATEAIISSYSQPERCTKKLICTYHIIPMFERTLFHQSTNYGTTNHSATHAKKLAG